MSFSIYVKRSVLRRYTAIPIVLVFLLTSWGVAPTIAAPRATAIAVNTCNASDLIAAIDTANGNNQVDIITLTTGCTYIFSTANNYWYGPNALPAIRSAMTIEGNGAILENTNTTRLRFFYVGADASSASTPDYNTPGSGNLTLRNLTLTGGIARGGSGQGTAGGGAGMGGAIFTQGTLTLESVTFTNNTSRGGDNLNTGSRSGGGGIGSDGNINGTGGGFGGAVSPGGSQGGTSTTSCTGDPVGNCYSGGGGGFRPVDNGSNPGAGGTDDGLGNGGNGSAPGKWAVGWNGGQGGGFGYGGGKNGAGGGGGVGGGGGDTTLNDKGGSGGFGGGGASNGNGGFGGGGGFCYEGGFGGGYGTYLGMGAAYGGGGAGMGGAIFNHGGVLTITNTTFSGNLAQGGNAGGSGGDGLGAAIFNLNGSSSINASTFSGNIVVAGTGLYFPGSSQKNGTIYNIRNSLNTSIPDTTLTLRNSIIANTTGGSDLVNNRPDTVHGQGSANTGAATIIFDGPNLIRTRADLGTATSTGTPPLTGDPLLLPLGNNGGPVSTLRLRPGSPALDASSLSCPVSDARGVARPQPDGGSCDLGAYESRGFSLVIAQGDNQTTFFNTAFSIPLQVSLTETGGIPIPGQPITFSAPMSGAGAGLSATNVTTDASGNSTITATANAIAGSYVVTASTTGVSGSVSFHLTNLDLCTPKVWNGSTSDDWDTGANWLCGTVPNASTLTVIPSGLSVYPIIRSAAASSDLNIAPGASVTLNGGNLNFSSMTVNGELHVTNSETITVSSSWSGSGTFTPGTGTVIINGNLTLPTSFTFYNLTINSGKSLSPAANPLSIQGAFTNNGTFTPSSDPTTGTLFAGDVSNAGTWNAAPGPQIFQSTFTNQRIFTPSSDPITGTLFTATVSNAGTWNAASGPQTFQSTFTNQSNAVFNAGSGAVHFFDVELKRYSTFNGANAGFNITHNWIDEGGFNDFSASTVIFDGNGVQQLQNTAITPVFVRATDSFESWTSTTPAGWTETILVTSSPLPDWQASNTGINHPVAGGMPPSGGGSITARFNSYTSKRGGQARIFTTTSFSTSALTGCQINLYVFQDTSYAAYNDQVQVEGSLDGINFNNVGPALKHSSTSTGWKKFTIDFSGYNNQAQVYLGLKGISDYGVDVFLDLLTVECVNSPNPLNIFNHLTIGPNSTLTLGSDLKITGDLMVNAGGALDLGSQVLSVDGTLTNNGILRQTQAISATAEFLHIQNPAGTIDKHFGVVITPDGDMGQTTVEIKGNQAACTNTASDPILTRCFAITPTTPQNVSLRFYFTEAERNGQDASQLRIWHHGSSWQPSGNNYTHSESGTGCLSAAGIGCWVQGENINAFSPFTLGSNPSGPTAVHLVSLNAHTPVSFPWQLAVLVFLSAFLPRHARSTHA